MGEYQEVDDFDDLLDSDGEDDVKTGDSDEVGTETSTGSEFLSLLRISEFFRFI